MLVIPDTLGGAPVVEIAAGAFADAPCKTVIFPDTLRRVGQGLQRQRRGERDPV